MDAKRFSISDRTDILDKGADANYLQASDEAGQPTPLPAHRNIRGRENYASEPG